MTILAGGKEGPRGVHKTFNNSCIGSGVCFRMGVTCKSSYPSTGGSKSSNVGIHQRAGEWMLNFIADAASSSHNSLCVLVRAMFAPLIKQIIWIHIWESYEYTMYVCLMCLKDGPRQAHTLSKALIDVAPRCHPQNSHCRWSSFSLTRCCL